MTDNQKPLLDKFKELARELEADGGQKRRDERLTKIAEQKPGRPD